MKKAAIALMILGAGFLIWGLIRYFCAFQTCGNIYGPAGDAFSGFVTPVITFISAVLIYFSFMEQVKANKQISNELITNKLHKNYDVVLEEYREMYRDSRDFPFLEEIPNLGAPELSETYTFKGKVAIDKLSSHILGVLSNQTKNYPELEQYIVEYRLLLLQVFELMSSIINTKLDDEHKKYLQVKFRHYYNIYYKSSFKKISSVDFKEESQLKHLQILITAITKSFNEHFENTK